MKYRVVSLNILTAYRLSCNEPPSPAGVGGPLLLQSFVWRICAEKRQTMHLRCTLILTGDTISSNLLEQCTDSLLRLYQTDAARRGEDEMEAYGKWNDSNVLCIRSTRILTRSERKRNGRLAPESAWRRQSDAPVDSAAGLKSNVNLQSTLYRKRREEQTAERYDTKPNRIRTPLVQVVYVCLWPDGDKHLCASRAVVDNTGGRNRCQAAQRWALVRVARALDTRVSGVLTREARLAVDTRGAS